jgi:hypothetical protein
MRKILVIISLLTLVNLSFSQENKSGLNISLKSGITFANIYGAAVESETFLNGKNVENFHANNPASDVSKTGVNFGFKMDYRFNNFFSLGIGTSYIQKGAKINANKHWNSDMQAYEDVNGKIFWNQNFWTIELPLTIYIPIKQNDIYFQVGLFKGYLINSEENGKISIANEDYEYTNDRRANEKEPGYFLSTGYIYSLSNHNGKIFTELTWTRSIIESPGSEMIPNPQYYYNQTLSFNIGYIYNINFIKK